MFFRIFVCFKIGSDLNMNTAGNTFIASKYCLIRLHFFNSWLSLEFHLHAKKPEAEPPASGNSAKDNLRLLQFGLPLFENGTFDRTNRKTSTTIDTSSIVDVGVFGIFLVFLTFGPVNALYRTNGDAITNAFAYVGNNGIGHFGKLLLARY